MRITDLFEDRDQGFTIDAYHGTTADFDSFDPSLSNDIGMHFGSAPQANRVVQRTFRAKNDPDIYLPGANIIPVKLRLRKVLRVKDLFSTLRTRYIIRAKSFWLETPGFRPTEAEKNAIYAAAVAADKARYKAGTEWGVLDKSKDKEQKAFKQADKVFWDTIKASAERQGYDGFVYNNRVEGKGDSYVVFDPKNVRVKHARFDPEQSDSSNLMDSMTGPILPIV